MTRGVIRVLLLVLRWLLLLSGCRLCSSCSSIGSMMMCVDVRQIGGRSAGAADAATAVDAVGTASAENTNFRLLMYVDCTCQ